MTDTEQRDAKPTRTQKDQALLGEQLKRAFPFPASGRFDDLLSAIDDAARTERG